MNLDNTFVELNYSDLNNTNGGALAGAIIGAAVGATVGVITGGKEGAIAGWLFGAGACTPI